jgi:hypothetical protein
MADGTWAGCTSTRGLPLTFLEPGKWKADVDVPQGMGLENSVTRFEGEKKEINFNFLKGMLQWRPEGRKTATQLLNDPWLRY